MRTILILVTLLAGLCARAGDLELTYLANEGFLLSAGEDQVLIDAFVASPYSIYVALPEPTAQQMLSARAPFADIELALTSHVHRDHFQPGFADRFLKAHPETTLVTSPQVLDTLSGTDNTSARYPAPGETATWSRGQISVEFLNLSHGSGRLAKIENLGHLIRIGDFRVLHLGDAAMDEANFARYARTIRDIDVALIPYWYFSSDDGRALIDRYLQARLQIAVHVPRTGEDDANLGAVRDRRDVAIAERPLQNWALPRK